MNMRARLFVKWLDQLNSWHLNVPVMPVGYITEELNTNSCDFGKCPCNIFDDKCHKSVQT